jgi:hypothetical protein
MSVHAVSHSGPTTPPAAPGGTPPQGDPPVDLAQARAARRRRAGRPRRVARERIAALRRTTVSDAVGRVARSGRPLVHAAILVDREYAITVRTASLADAKELAEAIERVVPALIAPGQRRCRIEATARQGGLPAIMVECAADDAQALDTLLRSLESITGTALRAKVIIHGADRPYVRTWVGTWIDRGPRRQPDPGLAGPPLTPAAA